MRNVYGGARWHGRRGLVAALVLCLAWLWCAASLTAQEEKRSSETDPRMQRWLTRFPQADANRDGILTQPPRTRGGGKRVSCAHSGESRGTTPHVTLRHSRQPALRRAPAQRP